MAPTRSLAGALGLALVAGVAVTSSRSGSGALLKAAGASLYAAFGGDGEELASLYAVGAECGEARRRLKSHQGAPWQTSQDGSAGGALASDAVATAAPTATEYWTVLWTEGTSALSYVWVMEKAYAGVQAYVLVDTTGAAQGVTLASNETTVNFVAESGALYKADISGFDVTELLDYCDNAALGTDSGEECSGMGLDYWDYPGKLYFVDAGLGYLMDCDYDGGNPAVLVKGIDAPYAVAVDKKTGIVFFTGDGSIYSTSYSTYGLSIYEVSTYLAPAYSVTGVATDSENGYVYWTGNDKVYRDTTNQALIEEIYIDAPGAKSVSTDWEQDLLFYTDDYGVNQGVLDGSSPSSVIAYLYNTTFVYVKYETTPTPAPTPVPSSKPSAAPTASPSSAPVPKPSSAPTASPSETPTPLPTALPVPQPSAVPTSRPTAVPFPKPSTVPTAVPVPKPSTVPTSKPTKVPVPSPTSVPTPVPIPSPTKAPTSTPSRAPSPSPTLFPTPLPTGLPTAKPSETPTPLPTGAPVPAPSSPPSPAPTGAPVPAPTSSPTSKPTRVPSPVPTGGPTGAPVPLPTPVPSTPPSPKPSAAPTTMPSAAPIPRPTAVPIPAPTPSPTTTCEWWKTECDLCKCA